MAKKEMGLEERMTSEEIAEKGDGTWKWFTNDVVGWMFTKRL